MKFLPLALAALVGFTEGRKIVNTAELNRRMQDGSVNRSVLMQGAKPYNKAATRQLDEDEGFEITGKYSIQFNTCISMTVQNADLAADANFIEMAANGDLVSDRDYILFNVCETEYCSYYAEEDKMTFIAEVGTYFQAISQYLPTKVEEYCEACEDNYDYCYALSTGAQYYPEGYEEEEEEEEEDDEDDEDDEDEDEDERRLRRLTQKSPKPRKLRRKLEDNYVLKFVDCQMCADYECLDFHESSANGYYDEDGEYVEAELDDAMEWLNGFSACAETNAYLDDYLVYSNLMCNAEGTGLEVGLFLDENCLMYTSKLAFADIMQDADNTYYNMISDVVEFTFTNEGIECYNPEVVWYNEVDYYYEQMEAAENGDDEAEEEDEDEEEEEEPEAAEWCQELVQEDVAVDVADCGGYEAEEEEEGDDDYAAQYDWYVFDLTANQYEDIGAVCLVYSTEGQVTDDDGNAGNGGYVSNTVYNGDNEGLFNYDKASASGGGMSGGAIFFVILVVVACAGGAAAFFMKKSGGSADKKKPLINEGTMA